ncbi:MAG TPA: hypothetical protein VK074_07910, partial [Fodinibius sp.]|nr:hypothetical protein [Fodinibius sp.]
MSLIGKITYYFITALFIFSGCKTGGQDYSDSDWKVRGGNKAQERYSELTQIDTSNVSELEVAWTYNTGDMDGGSSEMQTNPLIIDGTLFGVSPKLKVFALDAASGEEKWKFDPFARAESTPSFHRNRGVTYWEGGDDSRILFTAGSCLYALDTKTGQPIENFGEGGKTSLKKGLSEQFKAFYVIATSPGIIYNDLI